MCSPPDWNRLSSNNKSGALTTRPPAHISAHSLWYSSVTFARGQGARETRTTARQTTSETTGTGRDGSRNDSMFYVPAGKPFLVSTWNQLESRLTVLIYHHIEHHLYTTFLTIKKPGGKQKSADEFIWFPLVTQKSFTTGGGYVGMNWRLLSFLSSHITLNLVSAIVWKPDGCKEKVFFFQNYFWL